MLSCPPKSETQSGENPATKAFADVYNSDLVDQGEEFKSLRKGPWHFDGAVAAEDGEDDIQKDDYDENAMEVESDENDENDDRGVISTSEVMAKIRNGEGLDVSLFLNPS